MQNEPTAELSGKVIVVTGGTRGLGKSMAERLVAYGATVIVTSRKTSGFPEKALPSQLNVAPLDVTSESSVKNLFKWVDSMAGRIDVLVNNAGVGVFKPIDETSFSEWNETIQTNLSGAFLCSREAFPRMKKQGGGRIINIGSIADYIPLQHNSAYAASKFGMRGLTGVLNEEGKSHNVRASLVSPGAVLTEIWEGRTGFDPKDMLTPDDVAQTVFDIVQRPLHVRIDEVRILPPKGVL